MWPGGMVGAPFPRRLPLSPQLAPRSSSAPRGGPRLTAPPLASGGPMESARRVGEQRRLRRRRGTPAPLQVTRVGPLPAAPPLVSSLRGGGVAADRGRGARPQAGCETTAAAEIDCAGASSGLGVWEHRERSSWERVRTGFLEGGRARPLPWPRPLGDQPGAPHPKSTPSEPPSSPLNCLL